MAAALCGSHALQAQDRFVVEVEIPGMKNGVKAILVDTRNDKRGETENDKRGDTANDKRGKARPSGNN